MFSHYGGRKLAALVARPWRLAFGALLWGLAIGTGTTQEPAVAGFAHSDGSPELVMGDAGGFEHFAGQWHGEGRQAASRPSSRALRAD